MQIPHQRFLEDSHWRVSCVKLEGFHVVSFLEGFLHRKDSHRKVFPFHVQGFPLLEGFPSLRLHQREKVERANYTGLRVERINLRLREVERSIREVWVFNRNLTQPFLNKRPWPIIPWKCKLTFKYGSDPPAFVSLQSKLFSAEIFGKL